MLEKLLWIALAGALGTLARYGMGGLVHQATQSSLFPWGTFVVNILGCLVFGIVWAAMSVRLSISGDVRAVVLVGFMGAFTTFSSFIFDTAQLLEDSQWFLAAGNMALQNAVGLAALFAGMAAGRLI